MKKATELSERAALTKQGTAIAQPQPEAAQSAGARVGHYRWVICALLFFAATINYIDRQVIGILKPTLQTEIGWTEVEYSWIVFSFQAAYALGLLLVGRLMDGLGTRKGFSIALIFWSIAAMGHALARSVMGFSIARFLLGLGEAGNFPASIKTVAEWFPKRERGHKRRGACHASHRACNYARMGMGMGIHPHGRDRFRLAHLLAYALSQAGRASEIIEGGVRAHP